MIDVAYPDVYDQLRTFAGDALGDEVRVVDGYDFASDPGNVLLIGVPNINDESSIAQGDFAQEQIGYGADGTIRETGTINSCVVAWTGGTTPQDVLTVRLRAFGYLSTIAKAIRTDRGLGVTEFDLDAQWGGSGDVAADVTNGAACAVSFTVTYTALLGGQEES